MIRLKIYYVLRVLLSTLAFAAFGGLVLWAGAYAGEVFDVLLIAIGLLSVVVNLPLLALSVAALAKKAKWEWINITVSLVSIAIGVSLMLLPRSNTFLPVLLFLYAVVMPAIRVLLVERRRVQLMRELPKSVLGLFMLLVSLFDAENVMFLILGIAMLVLAALYLVTKLLTMRYYFQIPQEDTENGAP